MTHHYVRCRRERTVGNIYNYSYWRCPDCGYHPGGSEGPPQENCHNCGSPLYTDDPMEAACTIEVIPTRLGTTFRLL